MSQLRTLVARSSASGLKLLIKSNSKKPLTSATQSIQRRLTVRAMSSEVDVAAKAAASGYANTKKLKKITQC